MTRKFFPAVVLCVVLLSATAALADGDIYVGGPWGTKIASLPYTINAPGSYYLGGNLSYASGNGITINAGGDNVTLDLMGFSITGSGSGNGIYMAGRTNVEIRNGAITGWNIGIYESGAGVCHRIINVRLLNCTYGVYLGGNAHLIKGCEAKTTSGAYGFVIGNGTVSGCQAQGYNEGIYSYGGIVSSNVLMGIGASSNGILTGASLLIKGNELSNWSYGMNFGYGCSIIGNTILTASGQTGIYGLNDPTLVLDQNTVLGPGTPTLAIGGAKSRGNNAAPTGRF